MIKIATYTMITLLFIFNFRYAHSQLPAPKWSKCFGGSLSDWGEYIFPLQDGGFLMTGSSHSDDGDVSGHHSDGYYLGYDYWVARCDSSGNILWQQSYGGTQTDLGRGIVQPDAGHYVISGYAISNDFDINGNHGYYDLWLMKIDTAGNLIWGKTYGGTNEDDNWDLIETSDHGYLLTGATLSIDGDITLSHGLYDSWVVKTDSIGNLQWQKTFGGSSDEYFNQTILASDGNYIAVGRTFSIDGDVSSPIGNCDVWVVKFDTIGNIIWEKTFGGTAFEEGQAIVPSPSGGYIVTGTTYSNDVNISGNHGAGDVWTFKIDNNGNLLWQHCFGGSSDETSWGITALGSGYIIGGETFSIDGDVTTNYGYKDGWVITIDTSGNLTGQKNFGGTGEDWIRMVKLSPTGDMYGFGTSTSQDFDANNAHGSYDFFVVKFPSLCEPVTAAFSFSTSGPILTFTDNSMNATSWNWDFGDGTTSTLQNPLHEYLTSGNFTICLIAGNSCSADTFCQTIKLTVTSDEPFTIHYSRFTIYPNPLHESATIEFSIEKNLDLEIELLDMAGRKIKTIGKGNYEAGSHKWNFSPDQELNGMFLIQLKTETGIHVKQIVIQ